MSFACQAYIELPQRGAPADFAALMQLIDPGVSMFTTASILQPLIH